MAPDEERKRNLPHLDQARQYVLAVLDERGVQERNRATFLATGVGAPSASSARNLVKGKRVGADVLIAVERRLDLPGGFLLEMARRGRRPHPDGAFGNPRELPSGFVGADQDPSAYAANSGGVKVVGGSNDELFEMLARSYRQGYEAGWSDYARSVGHVGEDGPARPPGA